MNPAAQKAFKTSTTLSYTMSLYILFDIDVNSLRNDMYKRCRKDMYKSAKEAKLWGKAFFKQRLFTNWGAFPKVALADPVVRQRCIIRVGARHLGHRVALTLAHALLRLVYKPWG